MFIVIVNYLFSKYWTYISNMYRLSYLSIKHIYVPCSSFFLIMIFIIIISNYDIHTVNSSSSFSFYISSLKTIVFETSTFCKDKVKKKERNRKSC